MRLFSKTRAGAGYLAVGLTADGAYAVHVARPEAQRPRIEYAGFFSYSASPATALEKLAREARAARYRCGTLLEPEDYQLLTVEAPNVPADELKTAIRWRLKDMLDYRIDDATIDVLSVPVAAAMPARGSMTFAVSARNQTIQKRQEQFAAAKIPLSVIDIAELAQRNLSTLLEPEGRALAMLSFGAHGGLFTITCDQELHLARRIDVKLDQLSETDDDKRQAVHDRITLELQRSIDHFDRQHHGVPLAKLVLAPLEFGAVGLQEYLAANLYTPVELLQLNALLDLSKVPELQSVRVQQNYFLTIGAALRQEETA